MALNPALMTKLLGAIETDTLVFLCGAGLSMPPPSYLLSAVTVARMCYDDWVNTERLDPALRDDIDRLAGHFHARGEFESVFIRRLVPWDKLVGVPNNAHAAIADLLVTCAARAALSANFDSMIERWAEERKIAMRGALTGQEAATPRTTNPLIKFHGCMQRDPERTLWTRAQLTESEIKKRINSCSQWMMLNLPGKHLVVVGFWTDWGYLNGILTDTFAIDKASSVTVIDPSPTADLQAKAPDLWAKLNAGSNSFEHVLQSGDVALETLRTEYSKAWARRFYALGNPLAQGAGGTAAPGEPFDGLSGENLYDLRRDAQGVPYTCAATLKHPAASAEQAAYVYAMFLNAGATQVGAWLQHHGQSIRVVNGGGRGLATVRDTYKEPITAPQSDIVVCAGADDLVVPAKLIADGRGKSIIRPAAGGSAKWLTLGQARQEFGL